MTTVKITPRCLDEDLPDLPRRIQIRFFSKIDILRENPYHGGRLGGDLRAFRRIRLGRYRIIYYIAADGTVWIIAVGIRKEGAKHDIYQQVSKLVLSGHITLE